MSTDGRPPSPAESRALRGVAGTQADDELAGTGAFLQRICRGVVQELDLSGAVIHLHGSAGGVGVAAASDSWSAEVADLTFTIGEGPGAEASSLRRPVLINALTDHQARWPGFVEVGLATGLRAVFAFPLLVGGVRLGVLELYSSQERSLTPEEIDLALAYVEFANRAVLGDFDTPELAPNEPLVDHRAEVHQAQGMVMVDLDVDLAEALVRIRAYAFAANLPLISVARAIVAGYRLPESPERPWST
jgi:hypothetical protein